ncbi:MAG: hypothetical protein Q9198_010149, partial [Flavoplaca austrocitrina]
EKEARTLRSQLRIQLPLSCSIGRFKLSSIAFSRAAFGRFPFFGFSAAKVLRMSKLAKLAKSASDLVPA